MPDTSTAIRSEETFVNDFAARLEAKNSTPTPAPTAPATTPKASDTPTPDTADEELETPAASGADSDDDGEETPTGENGDEKDTSTATDTAVTDATKDATATKEEKDEQESDEEEDEGVDDTARVAEFQTLLKKHGLKATIDDLPADVRPLAKATLDNMQSAFTRTQMEATAFRKDRAEFEADRRYREEHPELAITEILAKHPDLLEKVNAQLEKLEDPDKKRLFENDVRDTRKAALDAVTKAVAHAERRGARADEIDTYTRRACAKLSLPYDVVIESVALALQHSADNEDERDLTAEQLDAVIARQARVLKRHTTAVVRETKKKAIQDRAKDRRTTTPAVRTGAGTSTPAPAPKAKPKTDAEFIEAMASKHGR